MAPSLREAISDLDVNPLVTGLNALGRPREVFSSPKSSGPCVSEVASPEKVQEQANWTNRRGRKSTGADFSTDFRDVRTITRCDIPGLVL